MERPDLSEAKSRAKAANWDSTLIPIADQYDDDEEESPHCSGTQIRTKRRGSTSADPWNMAKMARLREGPDTDSSDGEEDPEAQEREGLYEEEAQSGALTEKAKGILRGHAPDVTIVNDREIQVSLTFLEDAEKRNRVSAIIGRVIQHYSLVHGAVQADTTKQMGVFSYKVKALAMSPSTDSTEPRAPTPVDPEPDIDQHPVLEEFRRGLMLRAKFPGWKSRIINNETNGFSDRQLKAILKVNPEYNIYQVLKAVLTSKGEWRKFLTLYIIPKPQ